jgi:hypothetical protein
MVVMFAPQNRSGHSRATSRYARIKMDTTKPRIYSNVITTSSQTITPFDVQPCDYEKNHRADDKYNVEHLIAPKNGLSN